MCSPLPLLALSLLGALVLPVDSLAQQPEENKQLDPTTPTADNAAKLLAATRATSPQGTPSQKTATKLAAKMLTDIAAERVARTPADPLFKLEPITHHKRDLKKHSRAVASAWQH